jgi:hypothetical protein
MDIMMGISTKNPYLLLNYMGGIYSHFQKQVMVFKPNRVDEACVKENYLENIGHKKGQPSGSKQKEHREASKEGKKWKGKYNTTTTFEHHCKDLGSHYNHYNIDGNNKEMCWKLHLGPKPKNCKKDEKKKNLLATDSRNHVERSSYVDENISCT